VKPDGRGCEVKRSQVVGCGFLEARGEGTESLELVEEDLNLVALGVGLFVESRFTLTGGIGTNDRLHLAASHRAANRVGVVACIGDHRLTLRVVEELFGERGFVLLTRRDLDVERPPVRVDDCMDFCGESTT